MEHRLHGLAGRLASSGLAALVAAVALATALPIAHGHLTAAGDAARLCGAPGADGSGALPAPECCLCLVAGHGSAALGPAATTPATPAARAVARPAAAPISRPAAGRGPAAPRAPPAPG